MPQYPLAYTDYPRCSRPPQRVQVERTEEKGSDVNLATLLLYDASVNDYNRAIVISNDSDLKLVIDIVVNKLRKDVIVVNPNTTNKVKKYKGCRISRDLKNVATSYISSINTSVLASSQFPPIITDSQGTFRKPPSW